MAYAPKITLDFTRRERGKCDISLWTKGEDLRHASCVLTSEIAPMAGDILKFNRKAGGEAKWQILVVKPFKSDNLLFLVELEFISRVIK